MNLNATILGQAIAFVLFVLFCMRRMAAINGSHRKTSKKKLLTALLPQNEHIRTLTLQSQRDRPAEKSESGSPGNHRAG